MTDVEKFQKTLSSMRMAQRQWAKTPLRDRCQIVAAIGRTFGERATEVADLVRTETKKTALDAWFADIVPNIDLFTYWTGRGARAIRDEKAPMSALKFPGKEGVLRYEPKGLVGLITPWNYPVALSLRCLVPALVAGNGVLYKPSEVTPRTGELIAEIFNTWLPGGLLTVHQGGADAGELVVDSADHVIFIGSVATGRKVAMRCAETLKSVSLELGGKDAAVVLADCDLKRTVQGVMWGAMANSGQNCASIERVYVESAIITPFMSRMKGMLDKIDVAPVATPAQDKKVQAQLAAAEAQGATIHGTYPGPVLVTGAPDDAEIVTEETFGPVCVISEVKSGEDGVRLANASKYGLTTSIWTSDEKRAHALAEAADSGVVTINNVSLTAAMPFAPWSGRKESGHGVTNSPLAIREMVQPKFVLTDTNKDPEVWWYPISTQAIELARDTVDWLMAGPIGKLTGTFKILGGMKKRIKEQTDRLGRDGS